MKTHFKAGLDLFLLEEQRLQLVILAIRAIWTSRNKLVHEGFRQIIHSLLSFVLCYVQELRTLSIVGDGHAGILGTSALIWTAPLAPCIRVNFGAGFYRDLNASSSGAVIRNHMGMLMGSACFWREHIPSIVAAEALASLLAIQFACDLRFRQVEVEGDCAVVISKLNKTGLDHSEICAYISDAKTLAVSFEKIKFQHIKRGGNRVAHLLGREGYLPKRYVFWVEDGPDSIQAAVLTDENLDTSHSSD